MVTEDVVEVSDDDDISTPSRPSAGDPPASTKPSKPPSFIARRTGTTPSQPRATSTRSTASALLDSVAMALDPTTRQARQDTLSIQYLQNGQITQLNSQLRDANRRIDTLTSQLSDADRRYQDMVQRYHDAERRADNAKMMGVLRSHNPPPYNFPNTPQRSTRGRYRQEIYYRDGGRATHWYPTEDGDGYEGMDGLNDSPGTRRYTFPDDSPISTPSKATGAQLGIATGAATLPPRIRHHLEDSLDKNGKGKNVE